MCGICGLVYADRARPVDRAEVEAMTRCLRHRGPDDEAYFFGPGVALGHRRLEVIDPEGGRQPMSDSQGMLTITYNGEIYNFQALRDELTSLGARFRTRSDTEVLLCGYRQWGEDLLTRLVGMFAFALWDAEHESLLLARDRLGKKPLCWAPLPEGGLAFGSELSSLVANLQLRPRIDREALAGYIALGYVPGGRNVLQGVQRVAPGGGLRWKRGGRPEPFTWWSLAQIWQERPRDTRPLEEIEEQFIGLLETAVRDRLVSDVPLGAFLSGGLDSSTIAALMRRHCRRVETFSIGFVEPSYDELPYARRVAASLGTEHHDEVVRGEDPRLLLEIAARLDEPFADTSIVPTYVLCQAARRRVTVALSGDGGDELLAGYVTHVADAFRRRARRVPRFLRGAALWGARGLPDSRRKLGTVFKARQFLSGVDLAPCDAHAWWRTIADAAQVRRLVPGTLVDDGAPPSFGPARAAWGEVPDLGALDRMLYVDFRTWLPDDILVKADRAGMSHGLEVRCPFLDHRLVEFCCALPPRLKLRGGRGKWLLRRAARGLVPGLARRRRKSGFNAPVAHWLAGPWRQVAEEALRDSNLGAGSAVDAAEARRLLEAHVRGRSNHGYLLFALVMLGLWLGRVRPGPP